MHSSIFSFVGWIRYERTKHVLGLTNATLHSFFGTVDENAQAIFIGFVLMVTAGVYWSLGACYLRDWR